MNNIENNIDNVENNNKYKKYVSECVGWIGSVLVLIPYIVTG